MNPPGCRCQWQYETRVGAEAWVGAVDWGADMLKTKGRRFTILMLKSDSDSGEMMGLRKEQKPRGLLEALDVLNHEDSDFKLECRTYR